MKPSLLAALALVAVAAAPAAAFPAGDQFDLDALTDDGGGGRAFAGGPADAGHTCAVCHTEAPGRVRLRLEADHPELFTDGYTPGAVYKMRVVLEEQWAARDMAAVGDACGDAMTPYRHCDVNGFAMEIANVWGGIAGVVAPAGATCGGAAPADPDVHVMADGVGVTHNGAHFGQTAWTLCWTAPPAGNGTITAYLAAVDGNGGDGTAANPEDATGDDVAVGAVALRERGGKGFGLEEGGCSASGGSLATAGLVALALVALACRRRNRRMPLTIVAAIAVGASACATVKPHEKQDLARRKMLFAPDAAEDELDLHMQQSREGSAGGYGSAGGGCGCN